MYNPPRWPARSVQVGASLPALTAARQVQAGLCLVPKIKTTELT